MHDFYMGFADGAGKPYAGFTALCLHVIENFFSSLHTNDDNSDNLRKI